MKTTVDVFISYCFSPCCAGSIVTAVFSEITISDATPDDARRASQRVAYGTGAQRAMDGQPPQAARLRLRLGRRPGDLDDMVDSVLVRGRRQIRLKPKARHRPSSPEAGPFALSKVTLLATSDDDRGIY
jgi:hypothetical protein